jgi:hypothetical protein
VVRWDPLHGVGDDGGAHAAADAALRSSASDHCRDYSAIPSAVHFGVVVFKEKTLAKLLLAIASSYCFLFVL